MDELHTILADHKRVAVRRSSKIQSKSVPTPSSSKIPDVFFDQILVQNKLNRIEILVLMYIYRQVWCRPNLYRTYGFSQLLSYEEVAANLSMKMEELQTALRSIESFGFIETIRSGQYFVRKYFTQENDQLYGQFYDNF